MELAPPYLLFLGDAKDSLAAKTAHGIADWRPEWCLGQLRFSNCEADLGLPDMTIGEAAAAGAKTLVIGIVNPGGVIPDHWQATIIDALDAQLDVASGLHTSLNDLEPIKIAAARNNRRLIDVRIGTQSFETGTGRKRTGKRMLTVGTDCSVGKKYTALALEKEMRGRGLNAEFRATGQTGVMIAGRGIAIDAIVGDFISGAAEWLSPDNDDDHWDIIEGQGSLFHPSFAGVSLGLLHGSQPDAIVVCHEPTRTNMRNVDQPLPTLQECIAANLQSGALTNPEIRCIGVAVNTSALRPVDAKQALTRIATETGLPATDPLTTGVGPLIDELMKSG